MRMRTTEDERWVEYAKLLQMRSDLATKMNSDENANKDPGNQSLLRILDLRVIELERELDKYGE